jgi:MFS family permease
LLCQRLPTGRIEPAAPPLPQSILHDYHPWQFVLMVAGAVGFPLALLMLPVQEPARTRPAAGSGYARALGYIWTQRRVFMPLLLFNAFFFMMTASFSTWMPSVIFRSFGLEPKQIGIQLGPILLIRPTVGVFLGGLAIDALRRRGDRNGAARIGIISIFAVFLPSVFYPIATSLPMLWTLAAATLLLSGGVFPVGQTLLARIAPPSLSGQASAIYFLSYLLLGVSLGPTIVGEISDHVFTGNRGLGQAVSASTVIFLIGALICMAVLMVRMRGFVAPEDQAD